MCLLIDRDELDERFDILSNISMDGVPGGVYAVHDDDAWGEPCGL